MNIPYVMRKCSKCGRWLVASKVNFNKQKGGKYGLKSQCKKCLGKQYKQWCETNKEKVLERQKQWREANKEYKKQWNKDNRDKTCKHSERYRKANREKVLECQRRYNETNREKKLEKHKQWYKANREKVREYKKQYRQSPQGQAVEFNSRQKRRAKEQQGTGITKDQWLELMSFFDWRCAYSGEYLGGNDNSFNRTIDHIVPLNSGGDNMIWNCVPMLRNLNSSKNDKDMEKWYKEQDFYNPKRLQKIYEWQEYAFNKWGKDTQYFNSGDIQIKLI